MSKKIYFLSFLILCLLSGKAYPRRIKNLDLYKDAITKINTAVGYTTLIELPSPPTRVVVGDQDSFKIEFVGHNLAIKPLENKLKTNLFIFTKDEQFHCTLTSGRPENLQYIVRLKSKKYMVKKLKLRRRRNNVFVTITQYKRYFKSQRRELSLLIQNKRKKEIEVDPSEISLLISKRSIPISAIYIDKSKIAPGESIALKIVFHKKRIEKTHPINLVLAVKNEDSLWFPFSGRHL